MKDKKTIFIGILLAVIVLMAIGYAALGTTLNINGVSNITSNWDILFTDMKKVEHNGGKDVSSSFDATTAIFDVELQSPGDYVEYTLTVENQGTLDAILSSILSTNLDGTSAIIYTMSGVVEGDILKANEKQEVVVKVMYNPSIATQPSTSDLNKTVSITLNYVQHKGQVITPPVGPTPMVFPVANGTEFFFNPVTGQRCDNDYIPAQSETGVKEGCMKWFAFLDDESSSTVNLLLDHNTTATVAWDSSGNNSNGPRTLNAQLEIDTALWTTPARIISATEVAEVTGHPTFNVATTTAWFYFQTNNQTVSPTCQSNITTGNVTNCTFNWLYDRTASNCVLRGCANNPTGTHSGTGYWTSSPHATNANFAWRVAHHGSLDTRDNVDSDGIYGVRPVIEVDKSLL